MVRNLALQEYCKPETNGRSVQCRELSVSRHTTETIEGNSANTGLSKKMDGN